MGCVAHLQQLGIHKMEMGHEILQLDGFGGIQVQVAGRPQVNDRSPPGGSK
jgi:hypothetical protein